MKTWFTQANVTKNILHMLLVILISSSFVLFALAYYTQFMGTYNFFNSDTLFIPSLYQDIVYDDGSFWNWFLPPVAYFFPDMMLYFFASIFHDNHYHIIAVFGILQVLLTIAIPYWIFRFFLSSTSSLICCSFLSILITPLIIQGVGVFKYAAFGVFHYGVILSTLLCMLIFLHFLDAFYSKKLELKTDKNFLFVLIFSTLIGISITSDKLFLLAFFSPVILHWLYESRSALRHSIVQIKKKYFLQNCIIGLIITIAVTGLTGDKAIATEELLIGTFISFVLTLTIHYFKQKAKCQPKNILSYPEFLAILLLCSSIMSFAFTSIFYGYNNKIEPLNSVKLGFKKFLINTQKIQNFFNELIQADFLVFLCIVISLVLGFYIILNCCLSRLNLTSTDFSNLEALQIKKIELLAFISTGGCMITAFVICMGESVEIGDRYVINIFLIPLITFFPFVSHAFKQIKINRFHVIDSRKFQFILLFFLVTIASFKTGLASDILKLSLSGGIKTQYYPTDIQCLDNAIQRYQLKEGISGYWHAKWAYILSESDITMAQYDSAHKPLKFVTTDEWFGDEYDFALIVTTEAYQPGGSLAGYNLDGKNLIELNGEPEVVINCSEFDVLAYPDRKLRIEPIEES